MIPTQENPEPTIQTPQVPKKSSKLGVIILIVMLLVLVGAGIYYVTKPKPKTAAPAVVESGTASLTLSPSSETVQKGKTLTISVFEDSGDKPVNAVQAVISYPADTFDFQSIDSTGSAFEIQAQATGGGGKVTITRGQQGSVIGKHLVAKVNLVPKKDSGQAAVTFTDDSALLSSNDNKNILGQKTGGNYTIEAAQ